MAFPLFLFKTLSRRLRGSGMPRPDRFCLPGPGLHAHPLVSYALTLGIIAKMQE